MPTIHRVNLAGVDLNLLVVLEALLEEKNVTKAGLRVGLSQPATSNALNRLRALLGDDLLVRRGRHLVLTPRAEGLRPEIREALDRVRQALSDPEFSAAECTEVFRIGMSDYACFILLPRLRQRVAEEAPGVTLAILPVEARTAERQLDDGQIDLALDVFVDPRPAGPHEDLLDDDFVCVMREDHPLAQQRLTKKRFVAYPHLLISPGGQREGVVDQALAEEGLQRRVPVTIPHFLMAPHLIASTDLLGVLAARMARPLIDALGLVVREPPLALPGFTLTMAWHPRLATSLAHRWLRETIVALSED